MSSETKKVAIITGGTTGIGKEVSEMLAAQQVTVVLAARDKVRGENIAAALTEKGAQALFVQTDVSKEDSVKNLIRETLSHYGRIDYLFNNAGIEGTLGPLESSTEAVIDDVLAINIKGVALCIQHAAPVMVDQGGGVIINTASFVGTTMPLPIAVIYGASKAAVISITQSVAAGYPDQSIRVYAVCPWVTDTPMVDRLTGHEPEAKAGFGASINPSGKIATPSDIAGAVVALFNGEGDAKSGDALLVDSGGILQKIIPMSVA